MNIYKDYYTLQITTAPKNTTHNNQDRESGMSKQMFVCNC